VGHEKVDGFSSGEDARIFEAVRPEAGTWHGNVQPPWLVKCQALNIEICDAHGILDGRLLTRVVRVEVHELLTTTGQTADTKRHHKFPSVADQ
jgi:hypothetical protein